MTPRARCSAARGSLKHRGFTLIEVLVALAIVTVGMGALLATLSSSADTVSFLRDKTFAQWIALNHIAEIRVKAQLPATGKTEGEVDFADRRWQWQQDVLDTQIKGIRRLDVSVRPKDAPGNKDTSWYTTVSGIMGDAVSRPTGFATEFDNPPPGGGGGGQPGQPTGRPTVQPPGQPPRQTPSPNPAPLQ